jgi:hypothetical protein
MYAQMLHVVSGGLLQPGLGLWVVRTSFLTPTRQTKGGFRFST